MKRLLLVFCIVMASTTASADTIVSGDLVLRDGGKLYFPGGSFQDKAQMVGPKGDKGDVGPQGLKGDTGAIGPQGPKGDTGAQGASGTIAVNQLTREALCAIYAAEGYVAPTFCLPLSITTTSLPNYTPTQSYYGGVSATGGGKPYTWSIISGVLPDGLIFSTSGAISGVTNQKNGDISISVQAIDSRNPPSVATKNFIIKYTPYRDATNVTDYNKIESTIVGAVDLLNSYIVNNQSYSDALYNDANVEFSVPVQNFFGSTTEHGVASAKYSVHTIKYYFAVQASATRAPYSLSYTEYNSSGTPLSNLTLSSIPLNSCSSANDPNNPSSECVKYSYQIMNDPGISWSSAGSYVNLVKSKINELTYLYLPK